MSEYINVSQSGTTQHVRQPSLEGRVDLRESSSVSLPSPYPANAHSGGSVEARNYKPREIASRGEAIYREHIQPHTESFTKGTFVVIDVETGDYEIDDWDVAATRTIAGPATQCRDLWRTGRPPGRVQPAGPLRHTQQRVRQATGPDEPSPHRHPCQQTRHGPDQRGRRAPPRFLSQPWRSGSARSHPSRRLPQCLVWPGLVEACS